MSESLCTCGFTVVKSFLKHSDLQALSVEFDELFSINYSLRRNIFTVYKSLFAYQMQLPDAGSCFLRNNLFSQSVQIAEYITNNTQVQMDLLSLSDIFGEKLLEPNALQWHNDCIDYKSFHYRAILYLDDQNLQNGPLAVWPGSHIEASKNQKMSNLNLMPQYVPLADTSMHVCEVKKGDLLIFDSRTVHSRLSNKSLRPNRTITFEFFSKRHAHRFFRFSIPAQHISKDVISNIGLFEAVHDSRTNNNFDVDAKLWSSTAIAVALQKNLGLSLKRFLLSVQRSFKILTTIVSSFFS